MSSQNMWIAACGAGLAVLLIWNIALTVRLRKWKAQWNRMLGDTGVSRLDEILPVVHERLHRVESAAAELRDRELPRINQRLDNIKGQLGVVRYNAFAESGSDLSFSLAIVDSGASGVVLTGIHSRDHVYLYAKPLQEGQSNYTLTPEEKQAINQALNRK
jgi:hypothetical protein